MLIAEHLTFVIGAVSIVGSWFAYNSAKKRKHPRLLRTGVLISELLVLASLVLFGYHPPPLMSRDAGRNAEVANTGTPSFPDISRGSPGSSIDIYQSVCKDDETLENCQARIRVNEFPAERQKAVPVEREESNHSYQYASPGHMLREGQSQTSMTGQGAAKNRARVQLLAKKQTVDIEAETTAIGNVLRDIYNQRENGLIRSSFPSAMSVHEPSTVVVEVRGAELTQAKTALAALQSGDSFTEIVGKLRVSTIMSVSVTAQTPEAFKISSIDNPSVSTDPIAKPVASNGEQQWRWSVTPLQSGSQTLYVIAYITVPVPGQTVPPLQVYQKTQVITIPVVPFYKRSWWAARDALNAHWLDTLKWSWAALFVPLGLWLWRIIRPTRQTSKNKRKLVRMNKPIPAQEEHQDVPSDKVS